jgi:hypothetical protein
MDKLALGSSFFGKSFLREAYDVFSPDLSGVNSLLFVYMRMNTRTNRHNTFYEIFFSIDGKLLEIKDLNPAVDGDPFYVLDVSTGKKINDDMYNRAMDFILYNIVQRDGMNIISQTHEGKSIVILHVDYKEYVLSNEEVSKKLRELFYKHFIKHLGEM